MFLESRELVSDERPKVTKRPCCVGYRPFELHRESNLDHRRTPERDWGLARLRRGSSFHGHPQPNVRARSDPPASLAAIPQNGIPTYDRLAAAGIAAPRLAPLLDGDDGD